MRICTGFLPPIERQRRASAASTSPPIRSPRARRSATCPSRCRSTPRCASTSTSATAPRSRACRARERARAHRRGARRRSARRPSARRVIGQLSKGYRQRVGLADALAAPPRRPHPRRAHRRPRSQPAPRHARSSSRELGKERTVILSTHILPEVEAVCGARRHPRPRPHHRRGAARRARRRRARPAPRRARRPRRHRRRPARRRRRHRASSARATATAYAAHDAPAATCARRSPAPSSPSASCASCARRARPRARLRAADRGARMKALVIARRELAAYFFSPVSYLVPTLFLLVAGLQLLALPAHPQRAPRCSTAPSCSTSSAAPSSSGSSSCSSPPSSPCASSPRSAARARSSRC